MRIIFVGINNKPGKQPLCSSTKSGKLIDRIIKKLDQGWSESNWWVKSNLYNLEYCPDSPKQKEEEAIRFFYRVRPHDEDIFVLLGLEVSRNFFNKGACNVVEINHPSSIYGNEHVNQYILDATDKINAEINKFKN